MADYPTNALIAAAPFIFGFNNTKSETIVPVVIGTAHTTVSLCTDYEMGVAKLIPMKSHLALDVAGGLFLAISPWLFGFSKRVWAPHLIAGLLMAGTALMTTDKTSEDLAKENPEGIELDEETEDFLANAHLRGRAKSLSNGLH